MIVRRRRTILFFTMLSITAAFAYAHFRPLTFTTSTVFRPQGAEATGNQLMTLATEFGVNLGGGGVGNEASPAFYQELLGSREILTRVSDELFTVEGFSPIMLKDLLGIDKEIEAHRDQMVLDWLRQDAVSVSTGRETGTVTISVKTEWPDLSVEIAQRLLDEVALFNLDTRQSQAASERMFVERRVEEAEVDLEEAETHLRSFLETNRQWENSPVLQFQYEGLTREVMLRQSVLTTLLQSYEQARIQEVRDTPVMTVLQSPLAPLRHDRRQRVLFGLMGGLAGFLVGLVLAFFSEVFRQPAGTSAARIDFEESWDAAVRGVPLLGGRRD